MDDRHGLFGPGRDVDDTRAVAQVMLDARLAIVLGTSEDVDLDAVSTQLATEVTHVNIHATRFLTTQSGQRAGMNAEHGNPLHS
jgi:hypothetical protein